MSIFVCGPVARLPGNPEALALGVSYDVTFENSTGKLVSGFGHFAELSISGGCLVAEFSWPCGRLVVPWPSIQSLQVSDRQTLEGIDSLINLHCDGCDGAAPFVLSGGLPALAENRAKIARFGWSNVGDLDFCEYCTRDRAEKAKANDGRNQN